MKNTRFVFFVLSFLPGLLVGRPQFSYNGYVKNFFVVLHRPEGFLFSALPERQDYGYVNQRLRLEASAKLSGCLSLSAAWDLNSRVQDPAFSQQLFFADFIDAGVYRADDFDRFIYPDKSQGASFVLLHNLDRLFMHIRFSFADLYIGRQSIAWGSARIINPTDVLAPFSFDDLDTEERRGIDAIRLRIPVGFMGEVDLGYVPGREFSAENRGWFLRGRFYYQSTDISPLLMAFQQNLMAGISLARALGGAGTWAEAAHVWPDALKGDEPAPQASYFRASLGLDYSLTSTWYGFVEYHFNTAGSSEPSRYMSRFSQTAYHEGAVYLLGRHYLAPGTSYQITSLLSAQVQVLWNLHDGSFYCAPSLEYNISQNIYVGCGAFAGIGPAPLDFFLRSEFGSYPDSYYTSFRWYF